MILIAQIKLILLVVIITLLSLGANLAQAESQPYVWREITDALGRRVVMTAPPQRIVTVFSSNAETAVALGLADKIVGIDAYTVYPPEIVDRPKIGDRLGISLEQVVSRKPDLVLMIPARQAVHNMLPTLEKLGIPTAVFSTRTVEEIIDNLEKVSIITGTEEKGRVVLKDMKARFDRVRASRHNRPAPKVVFLSGRLSGGLFHAARKGGYVANMVEMSGGILALDQSDSLIPSFKQISPEALINADPDIIIYSKSGEGPQQMGDYLQHPAFSTLKAYRQGHVYGVPSEEYHIPGPRVIDGVERLADIYEQWDKQQ